MASAPSSVSSSLPLTSSSQSPLPPSPPPPPSSSMSSIFENIKIVFQEICAFHVAMHSINIFFEWFLTFLPQHHEFLCEVCNCACLFFQLFSSIVQYGSTTSEKF